MTQALADRSVTRLKGRQAAALGQLYSSRNALFQLMKDDDNLHKVKSALDEHNDLFELYNTAHQVTLNAYADPDDSDRANEEYHHAQHVKDMLIFINNVNNWISDVETRISEQLERQSQKSGSSRSSQRSSMSSTTRARLQEQANLAALEIEKESVKKEEQLQRRMQEQQEEMHRRQQDQEEEMERIRQDQRRLEQEEDRIRQDQRRLEQEEERNRHEDFQRKQQEQRKLELAQEAERRKLVLEQQNLERDLQMQQRKLQLDRDIRIAKAKERVYAGENEAKEVEQPLENVSTRQDGMNAYFDLQTRLNSSNPFTNVTDPFSTVSLALPGVDYVQNAIPVTSSVSYVNVQPHLFSTHVSARTSLQVSVANSNAPGRTSVAPSMPNRSAQGYLEGHGIHTSVAAQPYAYGNRPSTYGDAPSTVGTYRVRQHSQPYVFGNVPPGLNKPTPVSSLPPMGGSRPLLNGYPQPQTYAQHAPAATYNPLHPPLVGYTLPDASQVLQQSNYPPNSMVNNVSSRTIQPDQFQSPISQTYLDPFQQLVATMTLPQPEVPKFSGNPMEYNTFMMAFKSRIESRVYNESDRLYYLDQHLLGEPKSIIEGCLHMDPVQGYSEARTILQNEYGDPYRIAISYIDKVLNWQSVKNEADLKSFSIFLTKCDKAMANVSHMEILNHIPNLQSIVSKLPAYLQNKWREHFGKTRNEDARLGLPTFRELAEFIHSASKRANDPVYGRIALNKVYSHMTNRETPPSVSSFATDTNDENGSNDSDESEESCPSTLNCLFCQESHDIDDCTGFMEISLNDRRTWVKDNRLCFACFGNNHKSNGCLNKRKCETCNRKHPTSLHDENFVYKSMDNKQPASAVSSGLVQTAPSNANSVKDELPSVCHAILPVLVTQPGCQHIIKTYAFYDNGSSGCFLTEELREKMNAKGDKTSLTITTMNGTSTIDCLAVDDLRVFSLQGDKEIKLPKAYTRDQIPVNHSHIPRSELLKEWSHLKKVRRQMYPYDPYLPIGLLIGSNCVEALQPSTIVPSPGNGPFAALYPHGWVINGPINTNNDTNCLTVVSCNRVNVETGKSRQNAYNRPKENVWDGYVTPYKHCHLTEESLFHAGGKTNSQLADRHDTSPPMVVISKRRVPNQRKESVEMGGVSEETKTVTNDMDRNRGRKRKRKRSLLQRPHFHDLVKGKREAQNDTGPRNRWYGERHSYLSAKIILPDRNERLERPVNRVRSKATTSRYKAKSAHAPPPPPPSVLW